MKKIFYILCLMAGLTAAAQAQGTAPLTVQEVDGSPKKNGVTKIIVSNGTLTCTGAVCTIVTGGGGGSPGGSSSQVQYNDGAGGFAGSSGITLSATQATLVAPILGAATATSITASTAGLNFSGTNTTDNASVQLMLLRGNRATVTSNDEAYISLSMANAAAAQKEVARLTWAIFPNTAGAEGGRIDFSVMSSGTLAKRVQLSPTDFSPSSDDGAGLGAVGTLQWSDLFLASGGVIGWNNNNYTITHSAGNLAFSGSINKITLTAPANAATLTLIDGTTITGPSATTTLPGLSLGNLFTTGQAIQPATDVVGLTLRAYSSGTNHIQQNQTSGSVILSGFAHAGEVFFTDGVGGAADAFISRVGTGATVGIGTTAGGTNGVLAVGIVNLVTGIQIGGAAASRKMLVGNGTNFVASTETWAVPGTSGNVLTSDGTNWTSAPPSGGGLTIGTTTITSGAAGRILYETAGNKVGEIAGSSADADGAVQFAATARSSGVAQYFRVNTPADTGQTAATESVGAYFGGNGSGSTVTRTWAAGTVATQRENVFVAPTYAGASATATFTTAATVAITGPPAVGANAAITNAWALNVEAGRTSLPAGTAAAPSLSFAGSTDGFYRSGAGSIDVSISGTRTTAFQNGVIYVSVNAVGGAITFGSGFDTGYARHGAGQGRITNGSTGGGQLLVGGTSGTTVSEQLYVISGSSSRVALRVDSAATPSVDIFQVTVNGTAGSGFVVTSTGAPSSPGAGTNSERYGSGATAAGNQSVAVGYTATASGASSTAVGFNSLASGSTAQAFGKDAQATAGSSMAVGYNLKVSGAGSVVVDMGSIYINHSGRDTAILGNHGTANTFDNVALIGIAPATASNQIVIGGVGGNGSGDGTGMSQMYLGKGVVHATPTAVTINGTGGSGSNIAGADINIAGGKGTGTGATGKVNLQIARPGSTGSSLNALATAWSLNGTATSTDTAMTGGNGQTTVTGSLSESITLSTSGTTTDSTIDLPANSIILSVTGRVTTTITTATDWKLGDATISDRFSDANATLTAGTTTVGINQWKADRTTAGQGAFQQSTAKVRITTTGTPGAGVIRITVHYISITPATN